MKVNFISELGIFGQNVSGVNTSIRHAQRVLESHGMDYEVNGDLSDCDVCHFETPFFISLFKLLNCDKPRVISVHAIPEEMEAYALSEVSTKFSEFYLRMFYNKGDLLIAPSEFTKERVRRMGVTKPVEVISNGVDVEEFKFSEEKRREFREEHGFTDGDLIFYNVGFVMLRKGLETFIETAEEFPEYEFVWAGKFTSDDTKLPIFIENNPKKVRELVDNAPDNVLFTGFVDDITEVYSGCDVFLFPSHAENEGISILEACASENPVIVRNLPTYDSWLYHGRNAMKFETLEDLYEIIREVAEDESLRSELAEESYKVAVKKSLENVGVKLINAYKSVCEKG